MKMTTDIPASITAPDRWRPRSARSKFFDGVPDEATVEDRLRLSRSLAGGPGLPELHPGHVHVHACGRGRRAIGADASNKIAIWDTLMDSTTLLLTGNTSTMYAVGFLDLDKDGPTVIDLPPGCWASSTTWPSTT